MATQRSVSRPRTSAGPPPAQVGALQLMLEVGAYGAAISQSIAARVGDAELARNIPVLVIADLYIHGSRRPVEIQRSTGLSSGGVTKLLDRLETLSVITRTHGQEPTDRRAIVVRLSGDGVRVANLMAQGFLDHLQATRGMMRRLADEADALAAATGGPQDKRAPVIS
jgi:DNA-binding MarR family transcriptional regulator